MTALVRTDVAGSRARIAAVLLSVTGLCWAYLLLLQSRMGEMGAMGAMTDMDAPAVVDNARSAFAMPMTSSWTGADFALMGTMWAVMMAAMMIPSALPMIEAYAVTARSDSVGEAGPTTMFVAGYLVAWSGFAIVATSLQRILQEVALVDSMGASTSRWLAGSVLVSAGAYQFSPVKEACLRKCRTPLGFLLGAWRPGRRGALVMGLHHGSLCIGCCWALMVLLFVLGVMNLWWIAALATVVLIEKTTRNVVVPRVMGAGLAAWGGLVLIGSANIG